MMYVYPVFIIFYFLQKYIFLINSQVHVIIDHPTSIPFGHREKPEKPDNSGPHDQTEIGDLHPAKRNLGLARAVPLRDFRSLARVSFNKF
jgi:hypothetical protein